MPRVIAISGTPGAGKSVVAMVIGQMLDAIVWNLGDVADQHNLLEADSTGRDASEVDTDLLEAVLRDEIPRVGSAWLIIEGHYADVVPPEFVTLAVVLRCRPDVLCARLTARGYSEAKVKENVEAEILGVCTYDMQKSDIGDRFVDIDASDLDPESVASIIKSILEDPELAANYKPGII
ncbi:MAG TPA: AAA family ATPase, partial [Candidatus Lokiarchaeia archaeon]|nr:AAA family ATPase [Candidatus Lokiarchaeia archaeon]